MPWRDIYKIFEINMMVNKIKLKVSKGLQYK